MCIVEIFTIARYGKSKCPSTDEYIKRIWCTYTVEYYSAIKNNEILQFGATCMKLEDIITSEISQAQKDKYYVFSLLCGSLQIDFTVVDSRMMVTIGWEERGGKMNRDRLMHTNIKLERRNEF